MTDFPDFPRRPREVQMRRCPGRTYDASRNSPQRVTESNQPSKPGNIRREVGEWLGRIQAFQAHGVAVTLDPSSMKFKKPPVSETFVRYKTKGTTHTSHQHIRTTQLLWLLLFTVYTLLFLDPLVASINREIPYHCSDRWSLLARVFFCS